MKHERRMEAALTLRLQGLRLAFAHSAAPRGVYACALALVVGLAQLTACSPLVPPVASAPAAASPEAPRTRYDVIVVGAGMAGITAAKALRDAHLEVLVLEAQKRLGGRGITTEVLGKGMFSIPIDLGGSWIHSVKTNPLTPIVVGMGWKTQRSHVDAAEHFFFKGHFATARERGDFRRAQEAFESDLARTFEEQGEDAVGKDRKPLSAQAIFTANAHVREADEVFQRLIALNAGPLENAVELAQSSIQDSTEFLSADDDLLLRGYGTFVEAYGEDVRPLVRLETPVDSITMADDGVVVASGAATFEARKVLVTVSTGVLGAGKIAFRPPLPQAKREAIQGLPMGVLDKVILEFTTPDVFPTDGGKTLENTWVLYGGSDENGREDLAFVFQPMKTNIAVGFFGGDHAKELERLPEHGRAEMIRIAMKAMAEMCKASRPAAEAARCDVARAKKAAVTTAWHQAPWTLGSYSAALPGMAKMREALAEPLEHKVYFAGEACYNASYNGSYAAAYLSALRSSRAIVDCLGREDSQPKQACAWERITKPSPSR